jgi:reactive intermediate/imine deaminase
MAGEGLGRPAREQQPVAVAVEVAALARPGGHYSHAVTGAGLVFVSGQLPITPAGERLTDAPFEQQAAQVLANVEAALHAAGTDIEGLLQVRVYLDDIALWPAFDRLYAAWAGAARPARAVIPTGPLHFGLRVEMEACALARSAA